MGEKATNKNKNKQRAGSSSPDNTMNSRMTALLQEPGNLVCADCPARRPLWSSFFATSSGGPQHLGVFCCSSCAQHHYFELGERRCRVKYLKMAHEWTMEDIEVLEESGNTMVNSVFEANLTKDDFDKSLVLVDNEEEEDERRTRFIKHKYKKRNYIDELMFHELVLAYLKQQKRKAGGDDGTAETDPLTLEISIPEDSLTSIGGEDRQGSSSNLSYKHTKDQPDNKQQDRQHQKRQSRQKQQRNHHHQQQQQRNRRESSPGGFMQRAKARAKSSRRSLHDSCPNLYATDVSNLKRLHQRGSSTDPRGNGLKNSTVDAVPGSRRKSTDSLGAGRKNPESSPRTARRTRPAAPRRSASNPNILQHEEDSPRKRTGRTLSPKLTPQTSFRSRRGLGPSRSFSNSNLLADNDSPAKPIIRVPRKRSSTNLRAFHSSFNRSFNSCDISHGGSSHNDSSSRLSASEVLEFEADDEEELKILQSQTVKDEKKTSQPVNRLKEMADDFVQHTIKDMSDNNKSGHDDQTRQKSSPTRAEAKVTTGMMRRSGSKSDLCGKKASSSSKSPRSSMRRTSSRTKVTSEDKDAVGKSSPKDGEKKVRRQRSARKLDPRVGNESLTSMTSDGSTPKGEKKVRRSRSARKLDINTAGNSSMTSMMSGGTSSSIKREKKAALSALKASLLEDSDGKRKQDCRAVLAEKKVPVRVLPL